VRARFSVPREGLKLAGLVLAGHFSFSSSQRLEEPTVQVVVAMLVLVEPTTRGGSVAIVRSRGIWPSRGIVVVTGGSVAIFRSRRANG